MSFWLPARFCLFIIVLHQIVSSIFVLMKTKGRKDWGKVARFHQKLSGRERTYAEYREVCARSKNQWKESKSSQEIRGALSHNLSASEADEDRGVMQCCSEDEEFENECDEDEQCDDECREDALQRHVTAEVGRAAMVTRGRVQKFVRTLADHCDDAVSVAGALMSCCGCGAEYVLIRSIILLCAWMGICCDGIWICHVLCCNDAKCEYNIVKSLKYDKIGIK